MLVDDVIDRIGGAGGVAALAGRVKGAAELSLVKAMPSASPFAYVVPQALTPRSEGDASANAFTQSLDETIGVLLVVRAAGDAGGGKTLPAIDALAEAVMARLCGWGPDSEPGNFRLARGALVSAEAGLVLYQIDFSCQRQLRILS